jgi:hypothetical protein
MNSLKLGFALMILLVLGCAAVEPTAPIFDEKADARHDIAAAISSARTGKKNIVLIFGANW